MLNREEVKRIKEKYPKDTPVRLYSMEGENQMPFGMKGKVVSVDDIGQIHTAWENGSTLPLNPEMDQFDIISPEEIISEQKQRKFIEKVNGILEDVDFKLLNMSCNSENAVYAAEKLLAISSKYSTLMVEGGNEEVKQQVKRYITKYICDYRITVKGKTQEQLIDDLYTEMAEFSFLTKYIFGTGIEEIDINSWKDIEVQYSDGRCEKLEECRPAK